MQHATKEQASVAGFLTITTMKDGKPIRTSGRLPNKVVSSEGYGRNLLARQLAGETAYPLEIDTASIGDNNSAASDAQTDLLNPLVEDIPVTNSTAVDDVVTVDVFVPDANLPDDTYQEFALYCAGRMFARIVVSPAYTKASGEDTLFTYELNLT